MTTGKSHITPDENEKGMPVYDINITWLVFTYKLNFKQNHYCSMGDNFSLMDSIGIPIDTIASL